MRQIVECLLLAQLHLHVSGESIRIKLFFDVRDSGSRYEWGRRWLDLVREWGLECSDFKHSMFDILASRIEVGTAVNIVVTEERSEGHVNIEFEGGLLLFPNAVEAGGEQRPMIDWIRARLRDGNDHRTPRDWLNWIAYAAQAERDAGNFEAVQVSSPRLGQSALAEGYRRMSCDRVAAACGDTSADRKLVQNLSAGPRRHNAESLAIRLGADWEQASRALIRRGILEVRGADEYFVPLLFRAGLGIVTEPGR